MSQESERPSLEENGKSNTGLRGNINILSGNCRRAGFADEWKAAYQLDGSI
jgi:hypothetical protein